MNSIKEIIEAAGGITSVARRVGKSRNSVWAWQNNGVPDWHWPTLMSMAKVTPQQLFDANQKCPNRAGKSDRETAA
jgi:DNA-binding phage protein